ncbi:hypothetical protein [Lactiplantibacillus plajomi]|uniref:Uncharacterized protein n=1 Tax=Lactiplantibacillus plajomi TaxID=1457217 RepID=A0ABV6K408_9LACO|nr:hypothetical protein [Lactiplantibacillus plajomi]
MTPNEVYDALEKWQLLPKDEFSWRPFTPTTVFVETMTSRRVYRINLADANVEIFQADPSSELSEHFKPYKTLPLTASQLADLKHRHQKPVLQ